MWAIGRSWHRSIRRRLPSTVSGALRCVTGLVLFGRERLCRNSHSRAEDQPVYFSPASSTSIPTTASRRCSRDEISLWKRGSQRCWPPDCLSGRASPRWRWLIRRDPNPSQPVESRCRESIGLRHPACDRVCTVQSYPGMSRTRVENLCRIATGGRGFSTVAGRVSGVGGNGAIRSRTMTAASQIRLPPTSPMSRGCCQVVWGTAAFGCSRPSHGAVGQAVRRSSAT
jgi:hypothetical protein